MKLKPPSLQHVARFYRPTPEGVKREVLKLAKARPPFSYEGFHDIVWDMVRLNLDVETARTAIAAISHPLKRDSYLRALEPTAKYFASFDRQFSVRIEPRSYPIGRDLRVPFAPPMLCGTDRGLLLPWLIFWKENPLSQLQVSLFLSMIDDVIAQDSELDDVEFQIVDTSAKALRDGVPLVTRSDDVPRLDARQKRSMLEVVAEGFQLAKGEWARKQPEQSAEREDEVNQMSFFDPK